MGYLYTKPKYQGGSKTPPTYSSFMKDPKYNKWELPQYEGSYRFIDDAYASEAGSRLTDYTTENPLDVIARDRGLVTGNKPFQYSKPMIEPAAKLKPNTNISQGDLNFQSDPYKIDWDKSSMVVGSLAKLGMNAANVMVNKSMIERGAREATAGIKASAKLAKKRVTPTVHAAVREVAGAQDIPLEVQLQEKNRIASIKSSYAGSDPVLRAISESQAEDKRQRLTQEFGINRAQQLASERRRISEQRGVNQEKTANAINIAEERNAAESARIRDVESREAAALAGVKSQRTEAKRDLYTKGINQTVGLIDSAAAYNLTRKLKQNESALNSIDREMEAIYAMDPITQMSYKTKLRQLQDAKAELMSQAIPTYGEMSAGAFKAKKGMKLISKK